MMVASPATARVHRVNALVRRPACAMAAIPDFIIAKSYGSDARSNSICSANGGERALAPRTLQRALADS